MTGHDDLDRTLAGWLMAESAATIPPSVPERVAAATRAARPRPWWLAGPGSRWVGEPAHPVVRRLVLAALVVLALAAAGAVIAVGSRQLLPAPLRANAVLAYVRDGGIFVADTDGTVPRLIAGGGATPDECDRVWAEGPLWSPDGRHLAYRHGVGTCATPGATIADPDGRVTASFVADGWVIAWSPDSTRLAVWDTIGERVAIHGVDGIRQTTLLVPTGLGTYADRDPGWSPDGNSILLPLRESASSPLNVWMFPLDRRAAVRLPQDDPLSHSGAKWSPDGTRIAFVPVEESRSLVLAESDGSVLRVLPGVTSDPLGTPDTGEYHWDPIWSPTGDRVAYTWTGEAPTDASGAPLARIFELRVVDVATGKVTSLAAAPGISPIEFSQDGRQVMFRRTDADESTSIWIAETDGSGARQAVAGASWADWPSHE